jgi:hypothetical protein
LAVKNVIYNHIFQQGTRPKSATTYPRWPKVTTRQTSEKTRSCVTARSHARADEWLTRTRTARGIWTLLSWPCVSTLLLYWKIIVFRIFIFLFHRLNLFSGRVVSKYFEKIIYWQQCRTEFEFSSSSSTVFLTSAYTHDTIFVMKKGLTQYFNTQ